MIAKPPYPYLCRDVDRQGRTRWRLRMPGRKAITIKGVFGSDEFATNYRAAVDGESPERERFKGMHGTIDALARSYLRSAAFAKLAPDTRKARRYWTEKFIAQYGSLYVATLKPHNVKKIMGAYALTPGKARNVLTMLRVLMALAIEEGIRNDDPTEGIKRAKLSKSGWHSWTDNEIAQFEAKHPVGTMARLAFALALHTGQRAADLTRMGRQHISNGRIAVVQQKTGKQLDIKLHPELVKIMNATPSAHLNFIVTDTGKPYAHAQSFGNRMRGWSREAGLTGCPLHGLRKACGRKLAEAGCTAHEIMAILGHNSLAECERYCREAAQKLLGDRAIERTVTTHTPIPATHRKKRHDGSRA
jgi:integrase